MHSAIWNLDLPNLDATAGSCRRQDGHIRPVGHILCHMQKPKILAIVRTIVMQAPRQSKTERLSCQRRSAGHLYICMAGTLLYAAVVAVGQRAGASAASRPSIITALL